MSFGRLIAGLRPTKETLTKEKAFKLAVVEYLRDPRESDRLVEEHNLKGLSSAVKDAEQFQPDQSRPRLEQVQFLYEQRIALFNERRRHEWRALFATWGFFGAGDAAILNIPTIGAGLAAVWSLTCLTMAGVVWLYQRDLQRFVRIDRLAMDYLYNAICNHLNMHELYPGRERLPQRQRPPFAWAHGWQMVLLGATAILSAMLPWLLL